MKGWIGALVGALVPWLGPLVLSLVLLRRQRVWPARPARSGFQLAGVIGLGLGAVFIIGSSFVEWALAEGSALQFQAGGAWGAGDATLMGFTATFGVVFLLLAFGAVAKGGLRFGVPAAFVAAQAGSLALLLIALAGLAPGVIDQARQLSGGIVRLSLLIGRGAWLALLGCGVAWLGSLALLAKPAGVASTPLVTPQPDVPPAPGAASDGWDSWGTPSGQAPDAQWGGSSAQSTDGW